ncbi:hypothetical protein BB558_001089, partial [Smittium angustum]
MSNEQHGPEHPEQLSIEALQLKIQEITEAFEILQNSSNANIQTEPNPLSNQKIDTQLPARNSLRLMSLSKTSSLAFVGIRATDQQLGKNCLYIEELSRGFADIPTPTESESKSIAQEIAGSAQDLLRLAFHYTHWWKMPEEVQQLKVLVLTKKQQPPNLIQNKLKTDSCFILALPTSWKNPNSQKRVTDLLGLLSATDQVEATRDLITNSTGANKKTIASVGTQPQDGVTQEDMDKRGSETATDHRTQEETTVTTSINPAKIKEALNKVHRGFRVVQGKIRRERDSTFVESNDLLYLLE